MPWPPLRATLIAQTIFKRGPLDRHGVGRCAARFVNPTSQTAQSRLQVLCLFSACCRVLNCRFSLGHRALGRGVPACDPGLVPFHAHELGPEDPLGRELIVRTTPKSKAPRWSHHHARTARHDRTRGSDDSRTGSRPLRRRCNALRRAPTRRVGCERKCSAWRCGGIGPDEERAQPNSSPRRQSYSEHRTSLAGQRRACVSRAERSGHPARGRAPVRRLRTERHG